MNPEIQNCSRKIYALLFILTQMAVAATTATAAFRFTNETDYQALLAFKDQIASDPFNALSSWNNSIHFCAWTGVTCSQKHQRVTAFQVPSLQLVGPLSPHIWNLTFLRVLNLDENHLNGKLPEEIGRLWRLQELRLSNNSFDGKLPKNLSNCAGLRILYLAQTDIGGQIPDELGSLAKLTYLGLFSNRFTGELPPVLGNLSSLTRVDLSDNFFQGSIPPQFGYLSNLQYLQLGTNNISGYIPPSLYNVSSLLFFSVAENRLSGFLPSRLFLTLPKLEMLALGINGFSGVIPSTITNASRAVTIDVSQNALIGPIPVDMGRLENLQWLNFEANSLGTEEGDDLRFLASLINCTKLRALSVGQNRLKGVLPDSIANFSSTLALLSFYKNFVAGTIPSSIGNLANLTLLSLGENMLTGRIPSSIVKLSKLQRLFLNQNNLSGAIPSSLGNMTSLSVLNFENNKLEGTITPSLGNCKSLNLIGFSDNLLIGRVPQELSGILSLSGLSLARNHLTGPIPSQIGKLVNLQMFSVSDNNMSGEIPTSLGDSVVLEYLYLGGNQFNGTIPPSLSNLRGLKVLNLSRNHFSGEIPGFLANLPDVDSLNLSFNKFEGEVPNRGIFLNLTAVSVVGNDDLCGGPPSLQFPKCKREAREKDSKRASSRRTILVITVTISSFSLLAGLIAIILYRLRRSKTRTSSTSSTTDHQPKLSYGELSRATNGFSPANMIGEGSFGIVYQGVLPSTGQIVAVKVLKLEEQGASKSFMAECEALRNVRHRNLVKIITSCSGIDFRGEDFKALVFEFMPNGSLEKWLHPVADEIEDADSSTSLSLIQRLNIAIDVAAAVDYLHHQCHICIVHSDLKPSNVLLDNDFSAHISDFGISKILMVKTSGAQSNSIGVRGTIGYVAPEYGVGGEVSTRGDLYSFGILLLELFTGKRPTDPLFSGEFGLRDYVERSLPNGLNQALDPLLCLEKVQGNLRQCLLSILRVGLMCSAVQPNERMDIKEAAAELQKARDVLQVHRRRNKV